jgi:regulator of protease activity HflC (stomatin/prohibitin superfamily)
MATVDGRPPGALYSVRTSAARSSTTIRMSDSEGNGEAARILGNRERDLNRIQSEAYRRVDEIRGEADAKAAAIYAAAYNRTPRMARRAGATSGGQVGLYNIISTLFI